MDAKVIVDEVVCQGGHIWAAAGRLGFRLPADLNQDAWTKLFTTHRADLLAYLAPTTALQDVLDDMDVPPEQRAGLTRLLLDLCANDPTRITRIHTAP